MADPEKTVFISYRRDASGFIARSIFMDLRNHDFDVFMDVESIDSGAFNTILFNQIAARAHFIAILAPGTVERFNDPDDWMRREIEYALEMERNIVPVFVNNFAFDDQTTTFLTGKLEPLKYLNGLALPFDYFDEVMERLRDRFLKMPARPKVIPPPESDQALINRKIEEIAGVEEPTKTQLSAEECVNRAYQKSAAGEYSKAMAYLDRAIKLNPQYVRAFMYRGGVFYKQGKYYEAMEDADRAIQLDPQNDRAYISRSAVYLKLRKYREAIPDCNRAIQLNPETADAYYNRGLAYYGLVEYRQAIADFDRVIELDPQHARAYASRGLAYENLGQDKRAKSDFEMAKQIGSKL